MENDEAKKLKEQLILMFIQGVCDDVAGSCYSKLAGILDEQYNLWSKALLNEKVDSYNDALDDILRVATLSPDQAQSIRKLRRKLKTVN